MIKKIYFVLLSFLFSTIVFGQGKEIYLNDTLDQITKADFTKSIDRINRYPITFISDTAIVHVAVERVTTGKITKEQLDLVRNELSSISKQNIPKENAIVINYYHGLDKCNKGGDSKIFSDRVSDYVRKVNKLTNVSQFFVYKSPEGTTKYGKQITWHHDAAGLISNLFLPLPYPCGSYILLDELGNCFVSKGEYNLDNIITLLKNKELTFSGS